MNNWKFELRAGFVIMQMLGGIKDGATQPAADDSVMRSHLLSGYFKPRIATRALCN
jgi:hypothetical protein